MKARVLWWLATRLSELEMAGDPFAVKELPFGLWRLRARVCRALERLEERA